MVLTLNDFSNGCTEAGVGEVSSGTEVNSYWTTNSLLRTVEDYPSYKLQLYKTDMLPKQTRI